MPIHLTRISYDVGDIVTYTPFGPGTRCVLITGKDADIKNGKPGFVGDVIDDNGNPISFWGYDHQIIHVSRKTVRNIYRDAALTYTRL